MTSIYIERLNKLENKLQGLRFKKSDRYEYVPFNYKRFTVYGDDMEQIGFYSVPLFFGFAPKFLYRPSIEPDHIICRCEKMGKAIRIKDIDMFDIETIILLYKDVV